MVDGTWAVIRHSICRDEDIDCWCDSEEEAQKIANDLNSIYQHPEYDDGHPWNGDRFYVRKLTDEYIRVTEQRNALMMAGMM
jgi:hypothetical protein